MSYPTIARIAAALLTCACTAFVPTTAPSSPSTQPTALAAPTTGPSAEPTTRPLALKSPTTAPTTSPSTLPGLARKFPTPAELVEKFKKQVDDKKQLLKVAYFDLSDPVTEKPAGFSLFGGEQGMPLRTLIDRIRKAKDDADVRAVLLTIGAETSVNLAQAHELRDALGEVRRQGKRVFVYADGYDTAAYSLACSATDICLLPGGEIMIPGVGLETMFYKGAMEKVGVQADYIQIGEYKGAQEPYTRTEPTDELRGELTKLTDALYDEIVDGISLGRNVSRASVQQLIDDTIVTASAAKDRGFVDHVIDQDGLRTLIKDEIGGDVELVANYGAPKRESIDFSNPFALLSSLAKKAPPSDKPAVAVIYAEGTIVDGGGEGGLLGGGGVGSEAMRKAFRMAMRDDNVKAVVLRIDSPGGSALASEVMWQSARRLAAKKPLIVSVGSMAASGGYYLASAGDYIFADPVGIVGSIGVVGGKFVMKDLFEKVGLNTEKFAKGRNAGLFSQNEPWSDRQRRMVRNWMQQTYDQFTQRILTTRSAKIADIDKVARGRIFLAKQAKELGMVDELGGTTAAIAYAAKRAGFTDAGSYDVRTVPPRRTLADYFGGGESSGAGASAADDEETRLPIGPSLINISVAPDSILHLLDPSLRQQVAQQVRMMQLLQQRPVVLMSPFVVTVK